MFVLRRRNVNIFKTFICLRIQHAERIAAPHFREFALDVSGSGRSARDWVALGRRAGIEPGIVIDDATLLVCVTEVHSASDINRLVGLFAEPAGSIPPADILVGRPATEGSVR